MRKTAFTIFFIFAFGVLTFGQTSNCPEISVTGPSSVTEPGEPIPFSVSIDGKTENTKLRYVWSVSSGKIIEGQGTAMIKVGETPFDSTSTVAVEIKGLPDGCANTASETAVIGCRGTKPVLVDESEISSDYISSEKLDALVLELESNPDNTAYFIIYAHEKDSANELKNKENFIRTYLSAKKIEAERLIFVTADNDESESDNSVLRIWRVPPGAEPPTP